MARVFKWGLIALLALLLLLAVVAFTLHRWVGTDDFRERVAREASATLGVAVTLDRVSVAVWPLPAVALDGVSVRSQPPLTLERVEARPLWRPLLQGRLEVATLLVHRAVLPQQGIDAVLLLLQKKKQTVPATRGAEAEKALSSGSEAAVPSWLPRRTVLDEVTWVSAAGARTTVQAEATLGADGLPDSASLKLLEGHLKGLQAGLERQAPKAQAGGDQWALRIDVGGGRIEGPLNLERVPASARAGELLALQGQLQTRGVEVSALTAPNKPLTGQLEATTTLHARAATTGALADALQSQTTFTVRHATLNGLDLAKAVTTVGLSRGGQTRLDTLAGKVSTEGRAAQLSSLVASSGALSATGNVAVSAAQALSGRVSVNLAGDSKLGQALGGAVGVPLVVGGTLDKPEVTLTRGALLGAAVGTVMLPGVGTGAGIELGDRLGQGLKKLLGK
jgi:hypothetical protein